MAKIHDIQEEGELVELPEEEEVEVEDVDLCGKPQPTRKKMRMYSGRYKSTEKEWKRCFFLFNCYFFFRLYVRGGKKDLPATNQEKR